MLLESLLPNFMFLFAIFGAVGNILLIAVYISAQQLRRQFVIVVNTLFLGLIAVICCAVGAYFNFKKEAMMGIALQRLIMVLMEVSASKNSILDCQLYGFIISTIAVAFVHQLVLLAFERYIAMVRPSVFESITLHQKLIVSLLVFGYSLIVTVPPLFGWSRYRLVEEKIYYCGFDYITNDFESKSYVIYLFVNAYIIPCMIIATCFTLIYRRSMKTFSLTRSHTPDETAKTLANQRDATARPVTNDEQEAYMKPSTIEIVDNEKRHKEQYHLTKLAFFSICAFMITWIPYAMVVVIWYFIFTTNSGHTALMLTTLLGKTFIVWNPIIYGFGDHNFRERLVELFHCSKPSTIPLEDIGEMKTIENHEEDTI